MKGMAILGLLFILSGCSSIASLEELEQEAMLTGDWSAVERRERIIARRKARDGLQCPPGSVALCVSSGVANNCSCVSATAVHSLVGN